jgi:hypothetical protein
MDIEPHMIPFPEIASNYCSVYNQNTPANHVQYSVGGVVFAVFSKKLLLGALSFLFFMPKAVESGFQARPRLLPKDSNSDRSYP